MIIKNFLFLFFITFTLVGCSGSINNSNKTIRIKGSDTMLYLTDLLTREYMKMNPGISIYVEGGGTETGIKALGEGLIDICTASRPLRGEEVKILAENYRTVGMSTIIAKDALSIFVNLQNPINSISPDQIKKIFVGNLKSWNEFQWTDEEIIPVSRNPNSGTYLYFKEHILEGENYDEEVKVEPTTASLVRFISVNKNAIGYGGIGYLTDSVKILRINGIEPSENNVNDGTYPISRYLHFYTLRQPAGDVKKFIDWVISDEGQKLIRESGYVPIWIK